jgi:glyoxylase I family protein
MITIQNIDHVVLRVSDLDEVARFYIDVLGARWEKKQEAIGLYQLRQSDCTSCAPVPR